MFQIIIFFALFATVIVLSATVVKDGLGSRPGPRSHEDHDPARYDQRHQLR